MNGELTAPFWARHRGPFRLVATRPHAKRIGRSCTEWLTGEIRHGDDAQDEARTLLADPRDTIACIHVWSITEGCFVGGYHRPTSEGETRS